MAVRASREILIDAPPEKILDALAVVDDLPSWSPVHKHAEIIDRHPDGRPHHVKVTVKVVGLVDRELLEFHWGPDWVVWDAEPTFHQHGQHAEYTLRPDGADGTRVGFTVTWEPSALLPKFLVNRARKQVLAAATDGLRRQVQVMLAADRRRG